MGGHPGWHARSNAAAKWPTESDRQTRMRGSPSVGPAQVGQHLPDPYVGVEGQLPAGQFRAGPRLFVAKRANSKLSRNSEFPGRNLRDFRTSHFTRESSKKQVLAFVLFDPPTRPGGCIASRRHVQRNGSNYIGAARSRDAGYWPTAASPSLATIRAWNQRGAGISWPTARDTRCVGKEWGGLG